MIVSVNGKQYTARDGLTVRELLRERNIDSGNIIIELNHDIIVSGRWDTAILRENDTLEVLSFVGGG
jgi:sulfur carrier protein